MHLSIAITFYLKLNAFSAKHTKNEHATENITKDKENNQYNYTKGGDSINIIYNCSVVTIDPRAPLSTLHI